MALMVQKAVAAVAFSTVFGVLGTGLGGLTGALLGMRGRRLVPLLFNLSSGMMIAVVCFELLPQAYALGLSLSVMGMLLGVLCVMALSLALDRHHQQGTDAAAMRRTGLLVLLSLALHNFPEGLAVGAGYAAEPRLGLMLGIMIMLHDVPEGVASGLPLRAGGVSVAGAVGMTVLSGLPTGLGALIGYAVSGVSQGLVALNFGLAAGAMLQVTAGELLPRARDQGQGAVDTLFLTVGIAIGSVMTLVV